MTARFEELLRLWQDGDASPDELREFESLLRADPALRRSLVDSVRLEVSLYRKYAAAEPAAPRAFSKRRVLESLAAAVVVAASLAAVVYLLARPEPPAVVHERPVLKDVPAVARRSTPPAGEAIPADLAKLLSEATVTLLEAIDQARAVAAGVVVEAKLEDEDGKTVYVVEVVHEGRLREIEIDPKSGALIENEIEKDDRTALARAIRLPVRTLVEKALEVTPGVAIEVEAESERGAVIFEVKIAAGGRLHKVKLDPATGAVLSPRR